MKHSQVTAKGNAFALVECIVCGQTTSRYQALVQRWLLGACTCGGCPGGAVWLCRTCRRSGS